MRRLALVLIAALGCAGDPGPLPAPEGGSVAVDAELALGLRHRAEGFYLRLAHRRFDTLETYNDNIMRDYFQSLDLFFDYYADLAEDLLDADFDKSRPYAVEVLEFLFENPQTAQVLVRFRGFDGRPLRPGSRQLIRTDRWEWADGTWWIRPGKL
jgi:transposase